MAATSTARILGSALIGLAACAGQSDEELAARVSSLASPGPYAVGYRTFEVSYEAPLQGGLRTLTALGWYPSEAAPEAEDPLYFLRSPELAKVDAPPLALGPRPVVLLSHGHQGYPAGQSFLSEHLASHGFVVVAPTHAGNTFVDGDDRQTEIYYLRAFDVSKTLDALRAIPAQDRLRDLISDRVAVLGHSFGGYTAFMLAGAAHDMQTHAPACAAGTGKASFCSTMDADKEALFRGGFADPRISAVVSLDPGDFDLFGPGGLASVGVPTLQAVAEQSGFLPGMPDADPYWAGLSQPEDVHLLLRGGAHNDFTDACAAGLDIRCSELPSAKVWRAVRVYVQAFLRQQLEGEEGLEPILDGRAAVSELVEVTRR